MGKDYVTTEGRGSKKHRRSYPDGRDEFVDLKIHRKTRVKFIVKSIGRSSPTQGCEIQ